jgi:diguanylate cyclase (GGDEF)-like protein
MTRTVLCVHEAADTRALFADAVRAEGGVALETDPAGAHALLGEAEVILAGDQPDFVLGARLAAERPAAPRIITVPAGLAAGDWMELVTRVHPWAVLDEPIELERLAALVRQALAELPAERTEELRLPPVRVDFTRLVHDPLTGADSYHYLRMRLEEEVERAERYGRPLSLVLVDVDDLRALNDRHGRAVGDRALREVAHALQGGLRAADRVGRWAGGGFAVILPETVAGAALGAADRLRADIAVRRWPLHQSDGGRSRLRLTVSCGVAATPREGATVAGLVERADRALLRAKQGGRNRSVADG